MKRRVAHLSVLTALGLTIFLLFPLSHLAAAPTLKAPQKALVQQRFTVTVQPAPPDLQWSYDTSRLKLIQEGPGWAVFEALDAGSADLAASSEQTGWSSGKQTVNISPAVGTRARGKTGGPSESAPEPLADSPKMQKIRKLLDKYRQTLTEAGLESKFCRKDSQTEKVKVPLSEAESRALGRISDNFWRRWPTAASACMT